MAYWQLQLRFWSGIRITPLQYNAEWIYGCELWGNASKSNIKIKQRAQSKILRTITVAPWYLRNESIHRDLHIRLVNEGIQVRKSKHQAKIAAHENPLPKAFMRVYSRSKRNPNKYSYFIL